MQQVTKLPRGKTEERRELTRFREYATWIESLRAADPNFTRVIEQIKRERLRSQTGKRQRTVRTYFDGVDVKEYLRYDNAEFLTEKDKKTIERMLGSMGFGTESVDDKNMNIFDHVDQKVTIISYDSSTILHPTDQHLRMVIEMQEDKIYLRADDGKFYRLPDLRRRLLGELKNVFIPLSKFRLFPHKTVRETSLDNIPAFVDHMLAIMKMLSSAGISATLSGTGLVGPVLRNFDEI